MSTSPKPLPCYCYSPPPQAPPTFLANAASACQATELWCIRCAALGLDPETADQPPAHKGPITKPGMFDL